MLVSSKEILSTGFSYLSVAAVTLLQETGAELSLSRYYCNHVTFPEHTQYKRGDYAHVFTLPCGCVLTYEDHSLMGSNYSSRTSLILQVYGSCVEHEIYDSLTTYNKEA